jgi:hypothetical protein
VSVVEFDRTVVPNALAARFVTKEVAPSETSDVAVAIVGVPATTIDKLASVG